MSDWIYDRYQEALARKDEPRWHPADLNLPIVVDERMPPDTLLIVPPGASLDPDDAEVTPVVIEDRRAHVVVLGGKRWGKSNLRNCAMAMETMRLGMLGLVP